MKRLLLSYLLLLSSLFGFAQIEIVDNSYVEVQECSLNADQIYSRAKKWAAKTFNDLNNVLKMDDATNHEIVIKAIISQPVHQEYSGLRIVTNTVYATLIIACKDNKYRFKFEDLNVKVHQDNSKVPGNPNKSFNLMYNEFEEMAIDCNQKYKEIRPLYNELDTQQKQRKLTKEEKKEYKRLKKELVPLFWSTLYMDDVNKIKDDIKSLTVGLLQEVVKNDEF